MGELDKIKKRRSYVKGTITSDLNRLGKLLEPAGAASPSLDEKFARSLINDVEDKLRSYESFSELFCLELSDDDEISDEINQSSNYVFEIKSKLNHFSSLFPDKKSSDSCSSHCHVKEASVKLPLPTISLDAFENNNKNPFAYFTFRKAFHNALAGIPNLTNAQKLIYLRNFVKGDALNTIESIKIDNDGFETALKLLDFNFLNVEEIRDRSLDNVLSLSEAKSLKDVELLIRTVNSKLHDLKGLGLDLLEDGSAGLVLLSKIVCNKLPQHFLIELYREVKTNYPNFNQLVNVYQDILIRLKGKHKEDNGARSKTDVQNNLKHFSKSENVKDVKTPAKVSYSQKETAEKSEVGRASLCRFCLASGHSTVNCSTFPSVAERIDVANRKGWCITCLSGKHSSEKCPGVRASLPFKCYRCKKSEHHAAVCPTLKIVSKSSSNSLNYQANPGIISPVLSLMVSRGRDKACFIFLLDSIAQLCTI